MSTFLSVTLAVSEHFQDSRHTSIDYRPIDDGRCIADVTLKDVHKVTPYYPFGLALAAGFLLAKCVEGHSPAQGGTLEGFGKSIKARACLCYD